MRKRILLAMGMVAGVTATLCYLGALVCFFCQSPARFHSIADGKTVFFPLLATTVAAFAVALLVAVWLSQLLTAPLKSINPDYPLNPHSRAYPELGPLLEHLEAQNQSKEIAVETRREFSANVSHELKTPLTSISGYAEIIRNGLVRPEDIPGFAKRIQQEASRLLKLISDIMDLSRLDEGILPEESTDADLFEVCKDVVSRLQPRAMELFVALSLSGSHAAVHAVAPLLNEMVFNLVENAVKYNHEGGHVSVWVGWWHDRAQIKVQDDGIGIPLEDQERIFERFYRVDKSHSKETGGTGLGLSIVKHTALLHDAEISVDSEVGRGTTIAVTFPASSSRRTPNSVRGDFAAADTDSGLGVDAVFPDDGWPNSGVVPGDGSSPGAVPSRAEEADDDDLDDSFDWDD